MQTVTSMTIKFSIVSISMWHTEDPEPIYQCNILQLDRTLHAVFVMKNGKWCRQIYEVQTITEAISTRIVNASFSVF